LSQIAQQTTIQHNLVQELTEAKTAEQRANSLVKALETRVEEISKALDIATNGISVAAKDQNAAVADTERKLGEQAAANARAHKEREAELMGQIERLQATHVSQNHTIERLELELRKFTEVLSASERAQRESALSVSSLQSELETARSELERMQSKLEKTFMETSQANAKRVHDLENRIADLQAEIKASSEQYEKNEAEYQQLIEKVTTEKKELSLKTPRGGDEINNTAISTLRSQNEKLRQELENVSSALQVLESERQRSENVDEDVGFFGALLGGGGVSASTKKKIKELETIIESLRLELASKSELEVKYRALLIEHDALKSAPPSSTASSFGAFFGFS